MRQTRVAIGWKRLFAKSKWQTRVGLGREATVSQMETVQGVKRVGPFCIITVVHSATPVVTPVVTPVTPPVGRLRGRFRGGNLGGNGGNLGGN